MTEPEAPLAPAMSCTLYRLHGADGALLYVGVTVDLQARIWRHRYDKPWWDEVADIRTETRPNIRAGLEAEAAVIRAERPRYNVLGQPDLAYRAIAAYWRTAPKDGPHTPKPTGDAIVVTHEGKTYVVLSSARGTLAVYRVRTSGQLKRLRRCPKEVAA